MDVFKLRDSVIGDYQRFIEGFLHIRDERSARSSKTHSTTGCCGQNRG